MITHAARWMARSMVGRSGAVAALLASAGVCSVALGGPGCRELPRLDADGTAVMEVAEVSAPVSDPWPTNSGKIDHSKALTTIVFGSCARSDRPQEIWEMINSAKPELFLFIGDNVYVDIPNRNPGAADFAPKYAELAAFEGYQKLRDSCPILVTWDDHDYGLNDAGKEWQHKGHAQQQILGFFGEPEGSPRWERDGIYASYVTGPEGKRVQVIMLDTRFNRDTLDRVPGERPRGRGPYVATTDTSKSMLGQKQWEWLERVLSEPADVRVLGSSIQVVADEHGYETWGNMPHERQRLYDLIAKTGANGLVAISGDRHLMEISVERQGVPYPIWDFTSSGFNWGSGEVSDPNQHRVGPVLRQPNFGVIRIDWEKADPEILLEGRGDKGQVLTSATVKLSELKAKPAPAQ
ncbi:MAG: hypothetical protein C0475_03195 [Planctomyces sp.]|nr:hypothetical protein [Planctomyces sp.]